VGSYFFGIYGFGLFIFAVVVGLIFRGRDAWNYFFKKMTLIELLAIIVVVAIVTAMLLPAHSGRPRPKLNLVGVQMEFPPQNIIPKILNQALAKNTNAQIFVMSEYTLDGPVPDSLKNWCREHARFLVVGGKDPVSTNNYYNTAFVVGTNGDIVFKQVKSVPIQFFRDGLPAPEQKLWNSPWGKIGLCICYDLSYTRVTDELVRQGAQLIICPTMDVEYWGRHQHELHSRVAPVRAAEYGVPIFRVASSGISQAVTGGGQVIAQMSIPGTGEIFSAQLRLPRQGSLPLDRYLAPLCVGITGIITAVLLRLAWKDKRVQPKS
jgi:apolipoprotein N-acyltransferase